MQFLIITGLSGGGKSRAAKSLEDLGFYCVDNLPVELIIQFAQYCLAAKGRYENVAFVTDVRSGLAFDNLSGVLENKCYYNRLSKKSNPFFEIFLKS